MEPAKRTSKPVNQKSIYHSFADLYDKLMNDEIGIEKADAGARMLEGMNRTYLNEIKRAAVEHNIHNAMKAIDIRSLELKPFDDGDPIITNE